LRDDDSLDHVGLCLTTKEKPPEGGWLAFKNDFED
jgi:hypothetical protein